MGAQAYKIVSQNREVLKSVSSKLKDLLNASIISEMTNNA